MTDAEGPRGIGARAAQRTRQDFATAAL